MFTQIKEKLETARELAKCLHITDAKLAAIQGQFARKFLTLVLSKGLWDQRTQRTVVVAYRPTFGPIKNIVGLLTDFKWARKLAEWHP